LRKTLLVIGLLVLWGCDSREDFPPTLPITPPPTPTNFVVTSPAPLQYDLEWSINDPDGVVKEYWIYAYSSISLPDTVGTTTETSYPVETSFEVPGLVFGVSAVSFQNVESDLAISAAPDTVTASP
jgi:hypothetical protein